MEFEINFTAGVWKVKITNDGKYIAQLNAMFLDVYGTKETPKELNITVRSSDDSSVRNLADGSNITI